MEEEFEEPRNRILLVDNEIFERYEYQRETDLERKVSKRVRFVFGPKMLYFVNLSD